MPMDCVSVDALLIQVAKIIVWNWSDAAAVSIFTTE